ncbi:hypothetical protein K0U83_23785 [bacterium]|nr:hypothetical protein [bacterium]
MSSADSQAYAEESGDVLSRMNSHIQSNQRLREGIISTEEASDQFRSAARADKIASEGAIAGGASAGGAAVGIATSVIKNARKAFRAGKALSQLKGKLGNLRKGAEDNVGDEIGDQGDDIGQVETNRAADLQDRFDNLPPDEQGKVTANLNADETGTYGAGEESEDRLRAQNDMVENEVSSAEQRVADRPPPSEPPAGDEPPPADDSAPPPPAPDDAQPPAPKFSSDSLKPPSGDEPPPAPGDDLTATPTQPSAEDLLSQQVSSTTEAGTEQLGATASKLFGGELGDVADIGKLLAGGGDIADTLAGLATGGAAESLGLLGAASIATEALGPLSMFAGAGVGIWQAVSEEKAESKAADNAKKYEVMAQSLSAAPQLQTGSIAMPAMDSSQFRSGGMANF